MDADWSRENVETLHSFFQGGEGDGSFLERYGVRNILVDALKTILYEKTYPKAPPCKELDRNYFDNASFWKDALTNRQFPSAYIVLDDFCLLEWLPFSPGRYFTRRAVQERREQRKKFQCLEMNIFLGVKPQW